MLLGRGAGGGAAGTGPGGSGGAGGPGRPEGGGVPCRVCRKCPVVGQAADPIRPTDRAELASWRACA
ncbi:hypothetical protein DEF23_03260 [Marinitenerispora sediminis]|uniref:Uncharacterized protein n=1 Tax=Marinitenerispora sediminis TaxID=1931232 RepID=A0A368T8M3_9ACTN|nr:hypothetical protein DEF28_25005 [Marinitenerispora sediminis]RCV60493.1 hypothetical protein DEF24_06830 [Marinitenerispora sediminis]RCV61044.1 hypothetical protein DEF23_03260 [Marinitenerispora sediminis]